MKIAFFLFDQVTALDAIGPYEVLSRIPKAEVLFVAKEKGLIHCKNGLKIFATHSLTEVKNADVLVIPGGPGIKTLLNDQAVISWIQLIEKSANIVTSICTGSLLLAKTELLRGKKATTHWSALQDLSSYGVEVIPERFIFDEKFISAAGVSAGIDMSLALVAHLHSDELAQEIQLQLEYDPKPPFQSGSPKLAPKDILAKVALAYKN